MNQGLKYVLMTSAAVTAMSACAAGLRPVHTVEGIKSYELDNGLQIVLFADQSKPTATVNTTYLVGRSLGRTDSSRVGNDNHASKPGSMVADAEMPGSTGTIILL